MTTKTAQGMSSTAMAVIVLVALAGCPSSGEKPGARKSPPPRTQQPAAKEPAQAEQRITPPKLPAAEFQNPPVLPPSEPLPKLTEEPIEPKAVAPVEPPAAQPAEPSTAQPVEQSAATPPKPVFKTRTGKHSGIPFDPIEKNGPIFVGWPKPKLAIVITGMEDGYIEPCGCAGLDRMQGGMSRRYTFLQQLRKKGWPLVVLDVGGIARGFGRQAELKFDAIIEGKLKMGYNAIAFGASDLRLPAGELASVAAGVNDKPSAFVAANVGLLGHPGEIVPTSQIFNAGGIKVGVTAVLGQQYQKEIHNPEVEMSDPVAALKSIVPDLKRKADYLVLLAHATKKESIELAERFPQFNVVVTSDGYPVPPDKPETVSGTKTLLISVGHKGMDAIVLGLFDDAKAPFRYQRVPLDSRFPAAPEMKMLMAAYQDQLKDTGFAGLGLRSVPSPLLETNGRFVGSAKCESCHEDSYDVWKHSGHAHAYETLTKLDPPRNFDPECVSCHVIGWNPTGFFPYTGGYESLNKTPQLINTGCEDCHGPGEKHCAVEMGHDEALQKKLRKAVVVTKKESKKQQCYTCHDIDNSPDFDFDEYYPQIEHHEEK